ncbi:hypothetical protein RirG_213780 [Rhizophagus irregularis DAOM 197198w]|uniref:Uncharacterized protein n=1 Tax=Rhizophagus irregularis (strain DAOM 197198w) TaxID=1432141 RepID=A0A015IR42_RHIIW|nr:hypothetical protein RirG_213780 [Rhizophagus irregularis DAOM 197198w]
MSSDRFEEIPQLEDLEVEEALSLEASGSKSLPLKRKKPISHVIELESDTDTSGRQQIAKSRKYNKNNKNSEKIELNKITNQLVLIPNAKPPGQSWIWGYFDQYKPVGQYKRINGAEQCGHFMGSDNSTGNFIAHLATHQITEESHKRKMNEDNRPISICNDEGFSEFIHEFDPNYRFPSDKTIQQLLAEAYNQIKTVLTKIFSENVISCSITTDLWSMDSPK